MSLRDLTGLFQPRSIAVIGADAPLGVAVLRNLRDGGYAGPIAAAGSGAMPEALTSDLAVICLPVAAVPETLRALGAKGLRAALVLSGTGAAEAPALAVAEIELAARAHGIRLIGPDCFGVQVPRLKFNASIGAAPLSPPGRIGLIAQSTTVCAAALEWARSLGIGFSAVIGLGHAADVDFGDALDHLGSDPETQVIAMIVESIRERRGFIAAARAAARNKPILAIKIGVRGAGIGETDSHAGSLARPDAVFDAVFGRAGMLRVHDLRELFMATETLAAATPVGDGALTILANGHGIGVLAADELGRRGGRLAELAPATRQALAKLVAAGETANPINLGVDAGGERYKTALGTLLAAPETGAILALQAPTVLADPDAAADAAIAALRGRRRNLIACWIGDGRVVAARQRLHGAGIATYETPVDAVRAFMHLVSHRRAQEMLMQTPPSVLDDFQPNTGAVRRLVTKAVMDFRFALPEPQAKVILSAYGIDAVPTEVASDPAEAGRIARRLDCPVAVKVLSPDIAHKSMFGGVVLDLPGAFEVEKACHQIIERIAKTMPGARVQGFTVQPMVRRAGAVEIMIGLATDPVFGPVILFGEGGTMVEAIDDVALGLPPLNMTLSRDLIGRSRIARVPRGGHGRAPVDLDAIALALMKVSQLVVDVPEIVEMDINPLFADASGVVALDARMGLAPAPLTGERLAIRPYPKELEEIAALRNATRALLRPIRPEDEPNHHILVSRTTRADLRFRFFSVVGEIPHSQMARLTQIDYVREMAFVAVPAEDPARETLGVVRLVADADNHTAEFAVLVRSDLKGQGLGRLLLGKMLRYGRGRGIKRVVGHVLAENTPMLRLAEAMGFRRERFVAGDVIEMTLDLAAPAPSL